MIAAIIASAFLAGFIFGWPLAPALAGAGAIVCLIRDRHLAVVALAVLAAVAGALRAPDVHDHPLDSAWIGPGSQSGTIGSDVIDNGRSQRFVIEFGDGHALCARVFSRADFGRGDRLLADIRADSADRISSGNASYLRARQCEWSGTLSDVTLEKSGTGARRALDGIRSGIVTQMVGWVPGDSGALLAGLVIGDDTLLSDQAMDDFQRTGTLHVVAISGSNLTLLVSLLMIATAGFTRRRLTDALALAAVWGYVLIGGAGPPTVRAGFLATAAAGARSLGRPADLLTLSIQIAAIQAALWPSTVLGLSYRLSTAAIFGVLIAAAGRSFTGILGSIKLVVMTTVIVNAILIPILPASSRPSVLLSLVANTAIAPLVSVAFVLGLLAAILGFVHPLAGEPLAIVAGEINRLIIGIVHRVAGWEAMPQPLNWNGDQTPIAFLWLLALVIMLSVSTEFRRSVGDIRDRIAHIDMSSAMLVLGSGLGALIGTLVAALIR